MLKRLNAFYTTIRDHTAKFFTKHKLSLQIGSQIRSFTNKIHMLFLQHLWKKVQSFA
jgi:hypothetical protein